MYSKLLRILSLSLLALNLASCSLTTQDPEAPSTEISLKSLDTAGCLSNASQVLNNFFTGKSSPQELGGFWDCAANALKSFTDNTRGENSAGYSGNELARFLERYFLKNKTLSPAFMSQGLKLKRAILGGSDSTVTRVELASTITLIHVLKTETMRIQPYLPISKDNTRYESLEALEVALKTLISATDNIGAVLAQNTSAYSFADLDNLLVEFKAFLDQGQSDSRPTNWIQTARDYMEVLKWGKSVLITPNETEIAASDWKKVFEVVPRYLSLFMRADLITRDFQEGMTFKSLTQMHKIVDQAQKLLARAIENHPDHVITFDEFDHLLYALNERKLLPMSYDAVKEFVPTLVGKILHGPNYLYTNTTDGIRQENLDKLMHEFNLWSEGQFYLVGLYNELGGEHALTSPGIELRSRANAIPMDKALSWTQLKNNESREAILEIQKTINETRPFFPQNANSVVIPSPRTNFLYSYTNMTRLNLLKRASLLLIDSYKSYRDPKDADEEVSCGTDLNLVQAKKLFSDFFGILVSADLLTEKSKGMAKSRFFEANLFLSSSNGDQCLQPNETIELLATLLSVASKAHDAWTDIKDHGGCSVEEGNKDTETIDRPCVQLNLFQKHKNYWGQIPGFSHYLDRFDSADAQKPVPKEVSTIFDDIYQLAQQPEPGRDYTKLLLGEFQGFELMPYYVEMIFDRFDTDGNGTISEKESIAAFKEVYGGFLKENLQRFGGIAGTDKNAEAVYTYLLSYGKLPEGCMEKLNFYFGWRNNYKKKKFEADRGRLYHIFSMLLAKIQTPADPHPTAAPKSDCALFDQLGKILKPGGNKLATPAQAPSIDKVSPEELQEYDQLLNAY